jgi:surface protein
MGQNPFIDNVGDVFPERPVNTYTIGIQASLLTGASYTNRYDLIPTISHTMPIGLSDENKINNDSLSILFNSEEPTNTIGVQSYNVYTENDAYSVFYKNRITNIYDQNTRFVRGFFNLNYSDIQNLNPNDIIKINEQHFVLNKVEGFNLTNKELTSVELIQFNVNPQTYPDRYFKLTYCDAPDYCFQLKTDFTNPNLLDTNYVWSIYYDNQVGSLATSTTGFTSSFRVFDISSATPNVYVPYTMQEITKEEYDTNECYNWEYDTLRNYIYTNPDTSGDGLLYSMATFWEAGGSVSGFTGVNVWENCTDFYNTASTYGIITGSSTYYGTVPFVAKIDTTAVGNNYVVSLPYNSAGTYAGTIYWGDGTTSVNSFANRSHTYVTAGQYTIRIVGQITRFSTGAYTNTLEFVLTSVEQFGKTFNFTNVGRYFEDCAILRRIGYDIPLTGITSLLQMFYRARLFNQDLNHWNVSGVTNMNLVFEEANVFNGNISSWNTGNVTSMIQMFYNARLFNQDISGWNTSKVTSLSNTFYSAVTFNQPIGSWNVSGVTSLFSTFQNATSFNQPLNSWNVGNVTNMQNVFFEARSFNQPLNNWNTSKVTRMDGMFLSTPFNQDINSWDTSKVTTTASMFSGARTFNQPLNSWNVSGVTSMASMFVNAYAFNQDINSWNTANVTNMSTMFAGAEVFNGNIGSWNTAKVTRMESMFSNTPLFNQNIGSWNVSGVTNMSNMFFNARSFNQPLNSWNVGNVTGSGFLQMFFFATSFNQPLNSWNVSKATAMQNMFSNATSFNQNIGSWNVSGVTTMALMFSGAGSFTTTNLDNIYNGWSALPSLKTNVPFSAPPCYTAVAGRGILTGTWNWVITDGGLCP